MERRIIKTCSKHGETPYRLDNAKAGKYRCCLCASANVQRRRLKLKQLAIDYKGGKCEHCGYGKCNSALEFHHKDPAQKDFGISAKGVTWSFERLKIELDKCVMLCANCHREEHLRLELDV